MSRNLVIRLAITLVFISFVYILFWFFKVGQLEKRVTKFISDNNAYITAEKIESYGFPLSQNIKIQNLRFSIPNPVFGKRQISISELQATSGIFANDFSVIFPQGIASQNSKGEIARVKFNSDPNVRIKIIDEDNLKFVYEDSGYQMTGPGEKLVLSTKSSNISLSINNSDKNNVRVSIDSDIKEIEGFDVVDIYNNVLQEDIAKGIQTGKIKIGSTQIIENPTRAATNNAEVTKNPVAKEGAPRPEVKEDIRDNKPIPGIPSPEVTKENLSAEVISDGGNKIVVSQDEINKLESEVVETNQRANTEENQPIEVEQLAQNEENNNEEPIDVHQLAQRNKALQDSTQNQEVEENDDIQVIVEESATVNSPDQESITPVAKEEVQNLESITGNNPQTENISDDKQEIANIEKNAEPVANQNQEVETNDNVAEEDLDVKNRYNQGLKNNLKFSIVYTLSPNNSSEQLNLPFDPTKIQELPTQYNKEIKINNLEFSNKNYQILSNGTLSLVADDTMPSGTLSITIQKNHNFIGYLKDYIKVHLKSKGYNVDPVKPIATEIVAEEIIIDAKNPEAVNNENNNQKASQEKVHSQEKVQDPEVAQVINTDSSPQSEGLTKNAVKESKEVTEIVVQEPIIEDKYDYFLKKIYDNLSEISDEISEKNPATTNEE
ncbi:MAG: hypothetical protein ISQ34_03700, partial [Rickettsiales bacterium]|nr:hypothetical protein [Rickettsiales bacterium]